MNSATNLEPKEIIKRLGGTSKTAELCEITKGAVSQWLINGIPKAQLKFLMAVRPEVFRANTSLRAMRRPPKVPN
jgi:hypothetical protein